MPKEECVHGVPSNVKRWDMSFVMNTVYVFGKHSLVPKPKLCVYDKSYTVPCTTELSVVHGS